MKHRAYSYNTIWWVLKSAERVNHKSVLITHSHKIIVTMINKGGGRKLLQMMTDYAYSTWFYSHNSMRFFLMEKIELMYSGEKNVRPFLLL